MHSEFKETLLRPDMVLGTESEFRILLGAKVELLRFEGIQSRTEFFLEGH
jgi:hypothetical protein